MKRALPFLCAAILCGCTFEIPNEVPSNTRVPTDPAPNPVAVEPETPVQEEFASVDEAMAKLVQASTDGDKKQQVAAYNWLCGQGESAVEKVAATMNDSSVPITARRHACRVLGHLGPSATEPLIAASKSDEVALQLRAIETMPVIAPPQKAIVRRLIKLLDHPSPQVQTTAIRSLGQIGPAAKDSADELVALRDDVDLSETVRHEAGKALRLVNPRRTFDD